MQEGSLTLESPAVLFLRVGKHWRDSIGLISKPSHDVSFQFNLQEGPAGSGLAGLACIMSKGKVPQKRFYQIEMRKSDRPTSGLLAWINGGHWCDKQFLNLQSRAVQKP